MWWWGGGEKIVSQTSAELILQKEEKVSPTIEREREREKKIPERGKLKKF